MSAKTILAVGSVLIIMAHSACRAANQVPAPVWRTDDFSTEMHPVGGGQAVAMVSNGVLHVVDSGTQSGDMVVVDKHWQASPQIGAGVEARVKVVNCRGLAGVMLGFSDGVHEDILTLYTNRIELRHAKLVHTMETTGDFHVYRVDIKDCDLCVTVDGVAVIQGNGLFTTPAHAGRNRISFGAGSSAATGEAFWDWVRWTEVPITRKPNEYYVKNATHHVIYKQPGLYACFPSLFMDPVSERVFTTFTAKSVASHFPTADTRGFRMASSDGGLIWSEVAGIPNAALSDMPGPSFVTSDNAHVRIGHYWWRWYPMERLNEFIGRYEITYSGPARGKQTNTFATLSGAYVERSEDGGTTWERQEIPELDTYVSGSSPWSMTQLADGTVLRAFMVRQDANCSGRVMVALTHDGLATEVVDVMGDPENQLAFTEETLMHTTSDGTVWLLTRVHGEGAPIWQAVSRDGGRTWEGRPTEIEARQTPPSGLVKLDDGRLVLVYGYRYAPSGIRALISEDEGLTWHDRGKVLRKVDGG